MAVSAEHHEFMEALSAEPDPAAQVGLLEQRIKVKIRERQLLMLESINVQFGGSAVNTSFNYGDPRFDDGYEPWNEVGIAGEVNRRRHRPWTMREYDRARDIGRALWRHNGYAIGAHKNRQDYIAGEGVTWSLVAKDLERENANTTRKANDVLESFMRANKWALFERESVMRADRDGEFIARLFVNATLDEHGFHPLAVRFTEPEQVRPPSDPSRRDSAPFGVERDGRGDLVALYISDGPESEPRRVSAVSPVPNMPHLVHHLGNVDSSFDRGWPLMWAVRKALIRADKLKQNMSYVAALQAAIALIRKHEATSDEVQSFLSSNAHATTTNNTTGQTTYYQAMEPGTIVDAGAGITYEAPVSSVNAGNNVAVLRAELQGIAASLNLPEHVFSGDTSGGGFANLLAGESPFVKHMRAEQVFIGFSWREILWAAVKHAVFWNDLPAKVLKDYKLVGEFTSLEERQRLQEAQAHQIYNSIGVESKRTIRAKIGLDHDMEERNFEEEGPPEAPDKPPPGSGDGPGGADMRGNPDNPAGAPDSVAFSPEE